MNGEPLPRLILDAMTLRGLGPYLEGTRLEVRPLTILCGKNGSGKSTWLKMLNLLQRSQLRGLLPFAFDRDESVLRPWHDDTNALIKTSEELPPRDTKAESEYGPLGTIGLYLIAAQNGEWTSPLIPQVVPTGLDSSPLEFLWHGRCRRGTEFRLLLAHPTRTTFHLELDELVELRLDGMYTIRMHKAPHSRTYTVDCSGAFLPDRAADDTMIFVAEIEAATDGRSFSVRRVEGSVDSELQELLCRTAVLRIGDLLKSFLSGYFYIGAIRDLQEASSLIERESRDRHQEFEQLVERLQELAQDQHAEEAGDIVFRIKDYAFGRLGLELGSLIQRRYVGSRGQATHDLERAFAYNLMHHVGVGEPISGHIDQTFKAGDFSWRVEHEILEAAGVFEFAGGGAQPHHRRLWNLSDPESRRKLLEFVERRKQAPPDLHAMDELDLHAMGELEKRIRESIADMFNRLLPRRDLYEPEAWDGVELGDEASMLLDRGIGGLGQSDIARLNRLLIEAAFPFLEGGIWDHRAGFLARFTHELRTVHCG